MRHLPGQTGMMAELVEDVFLPEIINRNQARYSKAYGWMYSTENLY